MAMKMLAEQLNGSVGEVEVMPKSCGFTYQTAPIGLA